MNTKKTLSFVFLPIVSILFSANVLSFYTDEKLTDVDAAEKVSQYIHDADARLISQNIKIADIAKQSLKQPKQDHSVIDHQRTSVNRIDRWLTASSRTLKVLIPDTENRAVHLTHKNDYKGANSFIVNLPSAKNAVDANVTSDDSVVYLNYQQNTDLAIQPFNDSARILTILNGVDSPSEYSYKVNLPTGGEIKKDDNGGILVIDNKGSLIGGFATPWAIDSDGKKIPTHYEIRGDSVVQLVEHLDGETHYPVVADPWLWMNLIYSAEWTSSSAGQTLKVYPTNWARSLAFTSASYAVGVAGWNELYSKYKNFGRGIKINLTGMKDQYICHQQFVAVKDPKKTSWNLDEYRPNVGYLATVNASCNPGSGKNIFD